MTGFGAARANDDRRAYVVEVRAVNHKFCDVRTRLPRDLGAFEGPIASRVRGQVARGRIDVSVDVSDLPDTAAEPKVNFALAEAYHSALAQIGERLGLAPTVSLETVASMPGVIEAPETPSDLDATLEVIHRALDQALRSLNAMRDKEGCALQLDLSNHLSEVEQHLDAISAEIPVANHSRQVRLEQRIRETVHDHAVDPARLAQEIAILVDRADVTEEMTRLVSHTEQFRRSLDSQGPIGRKLDFILQEMHREANTIGSKSASARVSHFVVDLKSAVERIREQVQNIE